MRVWGGPRQSFSETLLFFVWISRLQKSGFKDNYERSAGKCVHKWKKKKAKWMLKPFLKQNGNRAFDPLSRNNKTFAWSPRVWAFPCPSVCTCMSICPHTDTHGRIHTHFLFSKSCIHPPTHAHGFHSFHFFLFFFSSSLYFFDISKLAVQEMAGTATSLFLLKKSMLILLLAVITYPRTHS